MFTKVFGLSHERVETSWGSDPGGLLRSKYPLFSSETDPGVSSFLVLESSSVLGLESRSDCSSAFRLVCPDRTPFGSDPESPSILEFSSDPVESLVVLLDGNLCESIVDFGS